MMKKSPFNSSPAVIAPKDVFCHYDRVPSGRISLDNVRLYDEVEYVVTIIVKRNHFEGL
jgi:hypothetical protein